MLKYVAEKAVRIGVSRNALELTSHDQSSSRCEWQVPKRVHPGQSRMIAIFAEENLAESRAKVRVEDGVYDRVKQTVEVAEPADDTDQ